jgi:hypothetical protein
MKTVRFILFSGCVCNKTGASNELKNYYHILPGACKIQELLFGIRFSVSERNFRYAMVYDSLTFSGPTATFILNYRLACLKDTN